MPKALPAQPHIDWLKKTAKERLAALRAHDPGAKLHEAQLALAQDYGFSSWRALKAQVDASSLDGQIIAAAKEGRAQDLDRLLTENPRKIAVTGSNWNRPLLHIVPDVCGPRAGDSRAVNDHQSPARVDNAVADLLGEFGLEGRTVPRCGGLSSRSGFGDDQREAAQDLDGRHG